ncbi:MAG TPA: alcohol dehydrogenase catalytic domain-containing protein [Candidatus Brocadiia bacterium]|nr:alcohol dehydrogenase catalytic domain-containing protein [Candidatus Brocadiia bacterium]
MSSKMKAVVYLGKNRLAVQDTPVPEIGEEEALVKVMCAGICGTDLHIHAGKHPRAKPPLIMGHEFSGVVAAINTRRRPELAVGARVVGEPLIECGQCAACRSGFGHVCQKLGLYGIDRDGAFAEYVKLPVDTLWPFPDNLSFEEAAMIEPLAMAVHAVRMSPLQVGDAVFVQGAGPIGLLAALVARQAGAGSVTISEREPFRLALAREYGLDAVDACQEDAAAAAMARTRGRGADVVFEAAGAPATIWESPKLCRPRATIMQVSMPKDPIPCDIVGITFRELTIKGVRVYAAYDFERAIALAGGGAVDLSKMMTPPLKLDDAEKAFALAREGKGVMRVLFRISGEG